MWIKTHEGTLLNLDNVIVISYDENENFTYGRSLEGYYDISHSDCTKSIINGINRGSNYMEVR